MLHIRWAALGLALILLAAKDLDSSGVFHGEPSEIEGTWEIVSVHRDGQVDPMQVGGHLTFADGKVTFLPDVQEINLTDARTFIAGLNDDGQGQVIWKDVSVRPDSAAYLS